MQTGALGQIIFTVSESKIETFTNFQRKRTASIATHSRHMQKDLPEFTGVKCDSVSLSVKLSKYLGAEIDEELAKLDKYLENGQAVMLIIGRNVYNSKWIVSGYSETAAYYDAQGNVTDCDVAITLTEYPS